MKDPNKKSLAEDIITIGFTLLLTATLSVQVVSAVLLCRAEHLWMGFALAAIAVLNVMLAIAFYCEVIVDKMDDLL